MSAGGTLRLSSTRRLAHGLFVAGTSLAIGVMAVPVAGLLVWLLQLGLPALDLALITEPPQAPGAGEGGIAHAVEGTVLLVLSASAAGMPLGLAVGVHLAEVGTGRVAGLTRRAVDVLAGVPSIVVGLFVHLTLVLPMGRFSALAGATSLALIMVPPIARTTEELCRRVPDTYREAALALGATRWRTTLRVVLPIAGPGLITGVLLAVARIAGETAPLLFTALGSRRFPAGLDEPTSSLSLTIYDYATSPDAHALSQAWAASLLLVAGVVAMGVVARAITARR